MALRWLTHRRSHSDCFFFFFQSRAANTKGKNPKGGLKVSRNRLLAFNAHSRSHRGESASAAFCSDSLLHYSWVRRGTDVAWRLTPVQMTAFFFFFFFTRLSMHDACRYPHIVKSNVKRSRCRIPVPQGRFSAVQAKVCHVKKWQ